MTYLRKSLFALGAIFSLAFFSGCADSYLDRIQRNLDQFLNEYAHFAFVHDGRYLLLGEDNKGLTQDDIQGDKGYWREQSRPVEEIAGEIRQREWVPKPGDTEGLKGGQHIFFIVPCEEGDKRAAEAVKGQVETAGNLGEVTETPRP